MDSHGGERRGEEETNSLKRARWSETWGENRAHIVFRADCGAEAVEGARNAVNMEGAQTCRLISSRRKAVPKGVCPLLTAFVVDLHVSRPNPREHATDGA